MHAHPKKVHLHYSMATAGAADGFVRPVYEGCISGGDSEVDRRPYHRNCGCALHSKSNNKGNNYNCPNGSPKCKNNVSYPIKKSWSEGNLALGASHHNSSPSASPLMELGGRRSYGFRFEVPWFCCSFWLFWINTGFFFRVWCVRIQLWGS